MGPDRTPWLSDYSGGGLSRRDVLKLGAVGVGGWLFGPRLKPVIQSPFPDSEYLGRLCVGKADLKAKADINSPSVGVLYQDAVVPWLREHVGSYPLAVNQTFVETPDGYVYAPYLQPVQYKPNALVSQLPDSSLGPGMWAQVTVPWAVVVLANPPARSPWLKNTQTPRLYYSQVLWIDKLETDDAGQVWYRANERFGFGDMLWAPGDAFMPLSADDLSPIRPEIEGKKVVIDLTTQSMSCYETNTEVYYARVSTGAKFDAQGRAVDKWSTPIGPHPIWRKVVSLHMVGGTTGGGYDLPGIGWTTLFAGSGVAIHSTFWHNDFGVPRSHGCVNARPEDSRWVFRWTTPIVPYDPGDITVEMPGGTRIEVIES
jgi:L,D-transpeptidase catalytic domain